MIDDHSVELKIEEEPADESPNTDNLKKKKALT